MAKLEYLKSLTEQENNLILAGLYTEAKKSRDLKPIENFALKISDDNDEMIAAITGALLYGSMYIDSLFVVKDHRSSGYGKQLMLEAEILAKKSNCSFILINTMDWEAKPFYEKLGFYVEYQTNGFDNNSFMYNMKKILKI